MEIKQLPLAWQILWEDKAFRQPTAIQKQVYKPMCQKQSLLAVSPTGSGKTLAYLLPSLQQVVPGQGNQLLILTSSQELAVQVYEVAKEWAQAIDLHCQSCIGGANVKRQVEQLKKKPEVIVGTPGRVLELIKAKKINAFNIQSLILDEADQLVKDDSQGLVKEIMQRLGKKTTNSFFSATADTALAEVKELVTDLTVIDTTMIDDSQGVVHHYYLNVSARKITDTLRRLCHIEAFQGLFFFNQLSDLGNAEEKLGFHHLNVASLASDQSKEMRKLALNAFKQHRLNALLATDIAARGIDLDRLPYVVNVDVPLTKESYLHRAGRVGRMGADGVVLTLVTPQTQRDYRKIMSQMQLKGQEVFLHTGELTTEKPMVEEKKYSKKTIEHNTNKPSTTVEVGQKRVSIDTEMTTVVKKKKKKVRTSSKKNKGKRQK
ncbi:DEAD/DEAH box helicase [uncultured Enterococcus sp.]|uniref:DEAD/DEAH box helicase n=1 Tax=uncultured Enterococcus sp. TaxID=167972 RepID=UPI0025F896FD|nr:DEAD/DEAH box helicase [uncultured Enterococcus sp.]